MKTLSTEQLLAALFRRVVVFDPRDDARVFSGPPIDETFAQLIEQIRPLVAYARKHGVGEEMLAPIGSPCSGWRVRAVAIDGGHVAVAFEDAMTFDRSIWSHVQRSREYEFVGQNIRHGLWRLDADHRVLMANPFLANYLEAERGDLLGQDVDKYYSDAESVNKILDAGEHARFEAEMITSTGLVRHVSVDHLPLMDTDGGRPIGSFQLLTDITSENSFRSQLVQEIQRMASLASLDPLTSLQNRRTFESGLKQCRDRASEEPFGLVALDLDGLKLINDTYGHAVGDVAIKETATRLRAATRETDWVARIGGDEFAVLSPGISRASLREVARRLAETLSFSFEAAGSSVQVAVSVGWAHSLDGHLDILEAADSMMYRDKHQRRTKPESAS